VTAPAAEVAPLLEGRANLAIAAINAPNQCVISGESVALAETVETLRERGVSVKELVVSQAFHSPLMTEVFDEFLAVLAGISFHEPRLTLISNLTGKVARPAELSTPEYWVRHIGEPVHFAAGMRALERRGRHVFVEIGPSASLTSLAKRCVTAADHRWITSVHPKDPDGSTIRKAVAQLYTAGVSVNWQGFYAGRPARRITLPSYPFDRKRYWLPDGAGSATTGGSAHHPLLGAAVSTVAHPVSEFVTAVTPASPGYLGDHLVGGQRTVPAAGHIEALLAVQDAVFGEVGALSGLTIGEPAVLADDAPFELRTRLTRLTCGGADLLVYSECTGRHVVHARALLPATAASRSAALTEPGLLLLSTAIGTDAPATVVSGAELYTSLHDAGLDLGDSFTVIESIALQGDGLGVAELRGGPSSLVEQLPPALLEAAWHTVAAVSGEPATFTPVRAESVRLLKKPRAATLKMIVRVTDGQTVDEDLVADVLLLEGESPVAELIGVGLRRVEPGGDTRGHFLHRMHWVPSEIEPSAPGRARHLLVIGRGIDPALADAADRAGMRLSFASTVEQAARVLREDAPTDVSWFWRRADTGPVGVPALRDECAANFTELLEVLGLLAECGFGRGQRLWLVTERAQQLIGDDPGTGEQLAASTLWGFGQVLLNEYPAYRPTLVDLAAAGDAAVLVEELLGKDTGEFQVCYRGRLRHVRRLRPYDPVSDVDGRREVIVRPDRSYLITGGLGALGLVTAEKLVDLGARHIVLVSRGMQPSPEAAESWDRLRTRAEITVHRADLGSPNDVAELMNLLRRDENPLAGVVHAAGALADAPISAQTWPSIEALFGPKVYGSWLLHEATATMPGLDFFVAYSSAASVVGGASQSNYAAANAFLDQLCHWRAAQGLPGLAINWGPWSEVGMSARLSGPHVLALEREGIRFFSPAKALRALASLLGSHAPQVAGGEVDWPKFMAAKPVASALYSELYERAEDGARTLDVTELLGLGRSERCAALRGFIIATVGKVLHIEDLEEIEPTAEFTRLGMDSLVAVELKNAVESATMIPLPPTAVFDYPTAEQLAEFVDRELVPSNEQEEAA
jgi:acyl transferase domain-containing protein/acyl carrier protein